MQTLIDWRNAKGWLLPEERELLFNLARELPAGATILNIGVEYGASVVCLHAGNPNTVIIASDIDWSKYSQPDMGIIRVNDSHELIKDWTMPLDLVFVDGDHGFAGVLLDARFADFLPVGGHILFQDAYDWDERGVTHKLVPGVNQAVSEWFSFHSKEFEELPYVGSTRVFKRIANVAS
jgi:predicted O-methyltransferase YrrM